VARLVKKLFYDIWSINFGTTNPEFDILKQLNSAVIPDAQNPDKPIYWETRSDIKDRIVKLFNLKFTCDEEEHRRFQELQSKKRKLEEQEEEDEVDEEDEEESDGSDSDRKAAAASSRAAIISKLEDEIKDLPQSPPRPLVYAEAGYSSQANCSKEVLIPRPNKISKNSCIMNHSDYVAGITNENQVQLNTALRRLLSFVDGASLGIDFADQLRMGDITVRWDPLLLCLFVKCTTEGGERHLESIMTKVVNHLDLVIDTFQTASVFGRFLLSPAMDDRCVSHYATNSHDGKFCPLFIIDEWGTASGGIAAFNMQLAQELADRNDTLVYVYITKGNQLPHIENICFLTKNENNDIPCALGCYKLITHLIGHGHITSQLMIKLGKDDLFKHCKKWMFMHTCPEVTDQAAKGKASSGIEKDVKLVKLAEAADVVWSVGEVMYDYWSRKINFSIRHECFEPSLNKHFMCDPSNRRQETTTTIQFLCFGRTRGVMTSKGIDVLLQIYKALNAEHETKGKPLRTFVLRGIERGCSDNIREELNLQHDTNFLLREFGDSDDVKQDLAGADYVIVPSIAEPFGLVGMEALAANVIPFVGSDSGIAKHLEKYCAKQYYSRIIVDNRSDNRAQRWIEKISSFLHDVENGKLDVPSMISDLKQSLEKVPLSAERMVNI
jgi:glycosyltransferase involved in cell wall biosynthesis